VRCVRLLVQEKMRPRRGAYFYVIDAFLAGIIITGVVVAMLSNQTFRSPQAPVFYTAEDLLSTLESTSIYSYDNQVIRSWILNGNLTDESFTAIEQLAYFSQISNNDNQTGNLSKILATSVPKTVNVKIVVDGQTRYLRTNDGQSETSAKTLFSSRRIVLVRVNPQSSTIPVLVEVFTWQ